MKNNFSSALFVVALIFAVSAGLTACGVQGPPQPPLTPAELGHGKPTFQRATEGFRFKDVPPVTSETPKPTPGLDDK